MAEIKRGLGATQVGFGFVVGIGARVELTFRECVTDYFARSLDVGLGEDDSRFGRRHESFQTIDLCGIGSRVDRHEQVAGFDQRPFAEVDLMYGAGHARANVDALNRFKAAGEFVPRQCVVPLDDRYRDRNSRWRSRVFGAAAAKRRGDEEGRGCD